MDLIERDFSYHEPEVACMAKSKRRHKRGFLRRKLAMDDWHLKRQKLEGERLNRKIAITGKLAPNESRN